jgi:hypothetical protein
MTLILIPSAKKLKELACESFQSDRTTNWYYIFIRPHSSSRNTLTKGYRRSMRKCLVGITSILREVWSMLNMVEGLYSNFTVQNVYIDAANPSFVRSLKLAIWKGQDDERQITLYKNMHWDYRNI